MLRLRLLVLLLLAGTAAVLAPGCDDGTGPDTADPVDAAAETITPQRIAASIDALAHDTTLGRGTPTPALDEAAAWLAAELAAAGLEPAGTDGYLQPFDYVRRGVDGERTFIEFRDGDTPPLVFGRDFLVFPPEAADVTGPLLWGGGITDDAVAEGLDIAGAFLLLDHPGPGIDLAWRSTLFDGLGPLYPREPAGIALILHPGIDGDTLELYRELVGSQRYFSFPVVLLTEAAAERLVAAKGASLAALREEAPRAIADAFRVHAPPATAVTRPANVVAMVEGSDPALRDRYIVVSAHYDHLGIGFAGANGDAIYNGADDNASGTAGLLEVARAMAALETPPRRSVLFLATAAEEKGLIGGFAFVADPTVPRDAIVADVNLDMISRNDPGRIFVVGKEFTTMGEIVDEILEKHPGLGLTPAFLSSQGLYTGGSDHAPFVRARIPAVFLFAGLHEDYHEPSDEPDRNDDDKAARVARLAFYLTHHAADDPAAVEFTEAGLAEIERWVR